MKKAVDWRTYVEKKPLTTVLVAFTGGVLLSVLSPMARRERNGYRFERSTGLEPEHAHAGTQYQKKRAADTWDSIKGALIGVAANEFRNVLTQAIPGFREQYEKAEQHKVRESSRSLEMAEVP